MRIQKIQIENFGKLHDFRLDLKDGLNLIRAENGWGKSTLAAFIKAMFYGLDYTTRRSLKDNERKKYMPWQGGRFGGSLEFQAGGKAYRVERSFGIRDREDTFMLYDLATGLESEVYSERLGEELFHLDRAAFERSSFFIQQDFAVSMNDSLSAGLTHVGEDDKDMQNYERAVASLEDRMKYYQRTGNRGQIEKLKEERRKLREMLNDLRCREEAAAARKIRITEKERREKAILENIRALEVQVQAVRTYGERAAKKAQHDLLKSQAYEKEEQLRKTASALAEFTSAPHREEELDQCREMLYRLNMLQMKEEEAAGQVQQAQSNLEQLESSVEKLLKGGILFRILMLFLIAAGIWMAAESWLLPGILLAAAGLALVCCEIWKLSQAKKRAASGRQKLKDAEEAYHALENKRDALEQKVCRFLHISEEADFQAMERCWKLERQRSREYGMLKTAYEFQRQEALKSREEWLRFRGRFSEEELLEFLNPEKPERGQEELVLELEGLRRDRENLIKELQDDCNQVRELEAETEQIPELEEEEERLSLELEAAVREYGLLEKTVTCLKAAREQLSVRYLKELQQGLLYYMELLEPEQKLSPLLDIKLKIKVQEAGALRELESFSTGWQDLLQIAERFSVIDALYKEEQPVLVLDDPFVNLDTGKRENAMNLLERMSEKRQMIYFTCYT